MLRINLKKLQKFDSSYFYRKSYFVAKVPRLTSGGFVAFTHISEWKSKGLSTESIKCLTTSNMS